MNHFFGPSWIFLVSLVFNTFLNKILCVKKVFSQMSKVIAATKHTIKLTIPAGKATPTPPVGPALGQKGVKSMDFCKQFNDKTKHFLPLIPIAARITVNPDKTFSFFVKTPATTWLLKQAAGIEKGSGRPGSDPIANLSLKHVYHIAEIKKHDPAFELTSLQAICKQILGTARTLGIEIVP
jgi:large subunit ribosomal protein L11